MPIMLRLALLRLLLGAQLASGGSAGGGKEGCTAGIAPPPPGHLQPLGGWPRGAIADGGTAHRPARAPIRTYRGAAAQPPPAAGFWLEHVDCLQPALFKGMATRSPAHRRWDDAYLSQQFGDARVKVEYRRENRLSDYCGMVKRGSTVECPDWQPSDLWKVGLDQEQYRDLRDFLWRWNDTGSTEEYVISSLPSEMRRDIAIPPTFGAFGGARHPAEGRAERGETPFYEANLWMSQSLPMPAPPRPDPHVPPAAPAPAAGLMDLLGLGSPGQGGDTDGGGAPLEFSSSVIHYDQNHQVMCLFSGTKEWIFIDPLTEIKDVPMWSEYYRRPCKTSTENGSAFRCDDEGCCPRGSDDSPIDGERVDLLRFPEFAEAEWTHALVEAGDCLFVPAFHLHYVRSWGRNVAASYMWQTAEKLAPGGEVPRGRGSVKRVEGHPRRKLLMKTRRRGSRWVTRSCSGSIRTRISWREIRAAWASPTGEENLSSRYLPCVWARKGCTLRIACWRRSPWMDGSETLGG